MKTTFLLLRIQTSKRIVAIFLLFAVLSMWAAADAYAQNKIKYTYDSAGNRLTRQKEIVIQTRGALSDAEGGPSTYEEKQMLSAWANDEPPEDDKEHGIQVYIGEESPVESMKDCSVVTATYRIKEGVYGKIGIVGPKRKDYEKVVGTLENCMQQLDDIFKKK